MSGHQKHESLHPVYFDDFDAFRILHNARYLLFVERTIGSFWTRLGWSGLLDPSNNPDAFHVVRANHIEYLAPVERTGELRISIWVERLGASSLVFGFEVTSLDNATTHAKGQRVLVCIDPVTRRPAPWSDSFRALVGPFVKPSA